MAGPGATGSNWDWDHNNQLPSYLNSLIPTMGDTLLGSGACWSHSMGLIQAVGETVLEVAIAITRIGEALIKGLGHLFGAPFHPECKILGGLKFTLLSVPAYIIYNAFVLPYVVVAQAIKLVAYPLWALASPNSLNDFVHTPSFPAQLFDKIMS